MASCSSLKDNVLHWLLADEYLQNSVISSSECNQWETYTYNVCNLPMFSSSALCVTIYNVFEATITFYLLAN